MFENLSDKLLGSLRKLRGQARISEENIQEAIKEIRMSLLEADVNFKVVKEFVDRVKEQALGQEVTSQVSPGQQFVKIVNDELTRTLGGETADLIVRGKPGVIFLVGLQGAGKTTTAAKLAKHIRAKYGKRPGLVPADVYRPAAIEQLKTLATQNDLPVFDSKPTQKPEEILEQAKKWAEEKMIEVVIVDTAGRLQIDDQLMGELGRLKEIWEPGEILLVADAMLGQQSVNVAEGFHAKLGLTGLVLTKIDGDARGGAALSIRQSTGVPIKFLGTGEKTDALEIFHPDRLASRILDMGDVVSLVEKAQEVIDEKTAMASAKKMAKNQFTVDDFLQQIQMMKKLGGMESIMKMIPGMGQAMKQMKNMAPPDKEIRKIEAIIRSMTLEERENHTVLNGSRRLRIANGSGTQVSDVNKFIKQFEESKKMMSTLMKMGMGKGGFPGMGGGGFPAFSGPVSSTHKAHETSDLCYELAALILRPPAKIPNCIHHSVGHLNSEFSPCTTSSISKFGHSDVLLPLTLEPSIIKVRKMARSRIPKQHLLFKSGEKAFGGELQKKLKGRGVRPLAVRNTMHLVLRSSKATGQWSFKKWKNEMIIAEVMNKFAAKYGVRIISFANVGNHLHIHAQLGSRYTYRAFIRAVTGAIAQKITGASRINPLKTKFWDYRPFTRVVFGFMARLKLRDYILVNELEGLGYSRNQRPRVFKFAETAG